MASSSDDDELPSFLDIRHSFSNTANKQSINDLFERNCVLIHELRIEKQVQKDAEAALPLPNFEIIDQENNLEANDEEMIPDYTFLKRPDNLQYFSLNDISLKNCGYNYKTEMSADEEIMFALEPHELFELILTGNVCRNILNVNSLIHFLIKNIALHSNPAIICSSQKLIKSLVTDSEDICFTCEDIFQILFNCSADVSTSEIFKILKPYRLISTSVKSSEPIPEDWLLNLKAALWSLGDILNVCRIPEEDMDSIVICFLILSAEREPVIDFELQKCLLTVLDRFFAESWPIYRLTIANSLGSLPNLDGQWLYVYEMVKAIPITSLNGDQLKKYICVRILLNLTDHDNKQSAEYSEELFSLSTLGIILHSLDTNEKRIQDIVIKFLDILVNHLKFTIEEYEQLCRQLKKAQVNILKNFEMSENLVDLAIIHARIKLNNFNIKTLKPLKSKHSLLKYADSDEDMSDHEITPNHVNETEIFEDAHDDIPPELEYCGMSSLSIAEKENAAVLETMEANSDDPKNHFEACGAFVNEDKKLTEKDNKVFEKTENDSQEPNCVLGASKETSTGEIANETANIVELKTLSHGPHCEESRDRASGQQSHLKVGDENGQKMTFPQILDVNVPNLIWDEHSYSNSPTEAIGFPLENSASMPIFGDLETENQHLDPTVSDSEFEINLTESGSINMGTVSLSKEISLNNNFFESINEIEPEEPLVNETIAPQISNLGNLSLSIKSNEYLNLNFEENNKLKTASSENTQVLEEIEGISSKESKVMKEEVFSTGALLVPEIFASTSRISTHDNLALSNVKLPNQDSLSKESSSKTNEATPAIIQSNLNNTKHLFDSNVPIYCTGICKQINSPASLVEETLEIVSVEHSAKNSLQLPFNGQSEKASDNSALHVTFPVYSTGICEQIHSPASLVQKIPEIIRVEQSVENSLQLPLNEQCKKASDNSALQMTLPVYSTGICKETSSLASLVQKIPEIVPVEQFAENVLQDKCEKTDNSLYETLDEQFRNNAASPLSLLNSLNEIYCKSKKPCLSSALSNNRTSNPTNSECLSLITPESQTSTSSMPDIVLSSLESFSSTPKRKLSTNEPNISPASQKRLKFTTEQIENNTMPTIIKVSAVAIAGKEIDNATQTEVKDYDSNLGRYTALSFFDTPTKNPKIPRNLLSSSSRTAKSRATKNDAVVIQVDSSDSEDDCQVVEVKKSGSKNPHIIFLD